MAIVDKICCINNVCRLQICDCLLAHFSSALNTLYTLINLVNSTRCSYDTHTHRYIYIYIIYTLGGGGSPRGGRGGVGCNNVHVTCVKRWGVKTFM